MEMNVEDMNNIYKVCVDIIDVVIDNLDIRYNNEIDKNNKIIEGLVYFFTFNNDYFDSVFEQYNELPGFNFENISFYKKCMLAIIVSSTYKHLLYNKAYGIITPDEEKLLEKSEKATSKKIFSMVENNYKKDLIKYVAIYFLNYHYSNYVYKNDCLTLTYSQKKVDKLVSLNPLEIFPLFDYIKPSDYTETELYLQNVEQFYNIYTITELFVLQNYPNLKAVLDASDEEFYAVFYDPEIKSAYRDNFVRLVNNLYLGDSKQIDSFYRHLFRNIYENMIFDDEVEVDDDFLICMENPSITLNDLIDNIYDDLDFFDNITMAYNNYFPQHIDKQSAEDIEKKIKEKGKLDIFSKFLIKDDKEKKHRKGFTNFIY